VSFNSALRDHASRQGLRESRTDRRRESWADVGAERVLPLGRGIQRAAERQNWNRYACGLGNPLRNIDDNGNQAGDAIEKTLEKASRDWTSSRES